MKKRKIPKETPEMAKEVSKAHLSQASKGFLELQAPDIQASI